MLHRSLIPWIAALCVPSLVFFACATSVTGNNLGAGGGGGDDTDAVTVATGTPSASASASASGSGSGGVSQSITAIASASAAMSSSASGVPATCTMKSDCAGDDDPCNAGNCVNGMCAKAPANEGGAC